MARFWPFTGDCDILERSKTAGGTVVTAVMDYFFRCFRIKDSTDSQAHLGSQFHPYMETLAPIYGCSVTDETDETNVSGCNEVENQSTDAYMHQLDTNELRSQAMFLKSCGTLPETPVEIQNGSMKYKDLSAQIEDVEPIRSGPFDATFQKLNSLPEQSTPMKIDGAEKQSGSLVQMSKSCSTDGQSGQSSISKNSIDGTGNPESPISININANLASAHSPSTVPTAQYRYRSVCFERESDPSSISSECISSETSQSSTSAPKYSPYPTPLKLTDMMQTPGAAFPASSDHMPGTKNARIRSHYLYAVSKPVENASQLKKLSEEDSCSTQDSYSGLLSGYIADSDQWPDETSVDKESESHSTDQLQSKHHFGSLLGESVYGKESELHSVDQVQSKHHFGENVHYDNGIPNITRKYKEDEVEESVEALSEERNQHTWTLPIGIYQNSQIISG